MHRCSAGVPVRIGWSLRGRLFRTVKQDPRTGLLLAGLLFFLPHMLYADGYPRYDEALQLARASWNERFPVPAMDFQATEERRLLSVRLHGIPIYYYRFSVTLPRLYRDADGSIKQEDEPARSVEVWFRYQPQLKQGDFAFVRSDLLPGTGRRWLE